MKSTLVALFLILTGVPAFAADSATWTPLQFLVGTWQGGGKAEDVQGKGETTFSWDLDTQVMIRRDHTEYAATDKHPAFTYEALMVIYKNPSSDQIEANFYDNGNHVIITS